VKLLLDEMYPARVAIGLRKHGHDVIAVQEDENLIESDDEALLRIAQDMERAVVTENVKDFLPLDAVTHGAGRAHYGCLLALGSRQKLLTTAVKTLSMLVGSEES
jgi:hypothetical protein